MSQVAVAKSKTLNIANIVNSPYFSFWKHFRKNRGAKAGLWVILLLTVVALFAPVFAPYHPSEVYSDHMLQAPIWSGEGNTQFLLGTDDLGRDLLSRLIYGARVSLGIGFMVVFLSMIVGTSLGLVAGSKGGKWDAVIMRFTDILMSLPSILLAIVIVAVLGPSLFNTIIAVSVVALPSYIRVVRASTMAEMQKEYVQALEGFGAGWFRIVFRNVLPNCMAPIVVQATLGFSEGILNAAALGFLGLGAQPPTPEWGTMLSDASAYIESSPWLVTLPGLCILIVVLSFNLLGDGLRDAFDPRLR